MYDESTVHKGISHNVSKEGLTIPLKVNALKDYFSLFLSFTLFPFLLIQSIEDEMNLHM